MSHVGLARTVALFALLPLLGSATITLPYNPTQIHLSTQSDGTSYAILFKPGTDSATSATLAAVDLSSSLNASDLTTTSLATTLPFFTSDKSTAFSSFLGPSGNITVLAGTCSGGIDSATLWTLAPDVSATGGGSWTQDSFASISTSVTAGANYLNAGMAFSEYVPGNLTNTDLYIFGGMCPTTDATTSTWQSAANYTDLMMAMTPENTTAYDVDVVSSTDAPVAEAGMTITALTATVSNSTGVATQQRDFVILGGHTSDAFINMSQVGLFSLPQAVWSFSDVAQPDDTTVTPRSGHTAVLTSDGASIVVYGGWVGDVSTPATPQLAILELGSGYGGTGSWQWSSLNTTSGTSSGTAGLFGHGAVMLPGNVMMVSGGYEITTSSSSRRGKRDTVAASSTTMLYNVTSNSWVSSYSAPATTTSSSSSSSSTTTTTSQKAGVGVGVSFGVCALVGAGLLYVWHSKRSKRRRVNRDSIGPGRPLVTEKIPEDGWHTHTLTGGRYDRVEDLSGSSSPEREAFPWLPDLGPDGARVANPSTREVDASGAFINIPSPTRGLRRGSGMRTYQYQATPGEEPRATPMLPGIHPIVEADEESSHHSGSVSASAQRRMMAVQEIFEGRARGLSQSARNPFEDPEPNPLRSHPVSPEADQRAFHGQPPILTVVPPLGHTREKSESSFQEWVMAKERSEGRGYNGRASPTKSLPNDDRTLSNLSDSNRSTRSGRSMARSSSGRSNLPAATTPNEERSVYFRDQNALLPSPRGSPTRNRSVTSPSRTTCHRPQVSSDSHTLIGAASDVGSRGGKPRRQPSSIYSSEDNDAPTSPRRRMNWVGSLRKAIGTYAGLERSASGNIVAPVLEPATYTDRSGTPSPTRGLGSRAKPRRTASDSSTFLQLKRGKDDWDPEGREAANAWDPYRDEVDGGDWGEPEPEAPLRVRKSKRQSVRAVVNGGEPVLKGYRKRARDGEGEGDSDASADEDWDIEKAAEKRDVQVMFTVPKARLRIVNADPDRMSQRTSSGGSKPSPKLDGTGEE